MNLSIRLGLHRRLDNLLPRNWISHQSRRTRLALRRKRWTLTIPTPGAYSFPQPPAQLAVPALSPPCRIHLGSRMFLLHILSNLPTLSSLSLRRRLARLYRHRARLHSMIPPVPVHIFHLQLHQPPGRLRLPRPPLHMHLLPVNLHIRLMIILSRWRRNMLAGQCQP